MHVKKVLGQGLTIATCLVPLQLEKKNDVVYRGFSISTQPSYNISTFVPVPFSLLVGCFSSYRHPKQAMVHILIFHVVKIVKVARTDSITVEFLIL